MKAPPPSHARHLSLATAALVLLMATARAQDHRWELEIVDTIARQGDGTVGRAWSMAVSPEGRLFVAGTGGVYIFSEDGDQLGRVGREVTFLRTGASPGPGEYASASAIGLLGDRLWVADRIARRVTLFDGDLEPSATWSPGEGMGSRQSGVRRRPVAVLSPASVVVADLPDEPSVQGYGDSGARLLVMEPEGTVVRELPALDPSHAWTVATAPPAYRLHYREPFAFNDLLRADPFGRRLVVLRRPEPGRPDSASYVVTAYGPEGAELWSARRTYRPRRLTDRDFDRWVDSAAARASDAERSLEFYRELYRKHVYRPSFYPPVPSRAFAGIFTGSIAFGEDGTVWVERWGFGEESTWDVFDAQGDFAGTARGPDGLRLLVVDGEHGWGLLDRTVSGEFGRSVVRVRVGER